MNPGDVVFNVEKLRTEYGLGAILIEESYIGSQRPEFSEMSNRNGLAKDGNSGAASILSSNPWWGKGGVVSNTIEDLLF